jgi:nitrous oxidase accessory protein NosD
VVIALTVVFLMSVGLVGPASAHGGNTIVRPGESIQQAINAADPGDRIVVRAGTYREQLTIEKDGIDLVGLGANLVPPPSVNQPAGNVCSGLAGPGTQAGICVAGARVELAPFFVEHRKVLSVGRPVRNVSITGFQVKGFSGANIAVVGAKDARITENRLVDGDQYGFLTAGSENTRVIGNTVVSSRALRFIGICMDNVSGVRVSKNHISGYNVALCVQTPGAEVRNNEVRNSCIGAFIDPFIAGAQIENNHIAATNPRCATQNTFGGFGIIVDGAVDTDVRGNRIEGQTLGAPGTNTFAAGIAVVDDPTTTPVAVATGNKVTHNTLRNNDLDLLVASVGAGNVIARNTCHSSDPQGLCAGQ